MDWFRKILRYLKINVFLPLYQKGVVFRLRHKERINVVFIAFSLPMWRYQNLYSLMSKHPRFNVLVVILPAISFTKEQRQDNYKELKDYFTSQNMTFLLGISDEGCLDIKKELKPDILFYPQPYIEMFSESFRYDKFRYSLLCYYPYAFWTATGDWSYNLPLHNYAWKLFYSTELHRNEAQSIAFNKGQNVEVVGYPNADNFINQPFKDVWKKQERRKKRIIWAPHFTICDGGYMEQSNFLWMATFMLEIANQYSDRIQFVFKPHPRLFSELEKNKEWGKEKAQLYYEAWETKSNTQIETGEYVDLFMTSDAMIHDCGSFSVEYHYSGKPVMFVSKDFEKLIVEKGKFGQLAMRQHYVGNTKQDIIDFIENVVLKGDDPMKKGREQFMKDYLLPPNGKTVAQNTMDVLLKAFC